MRRLVLLLPLLLACQGPTGPTYGIPNAVPITSPATAAVMDSLWTLDQTCSGIHTTGSWRRIQWFAIAADSFPYSTGEWAAGLWMAQHRIYLATGMLTDPRFPADADTNRYEFVIQHEMLHDLTQSGDHGAAFRACYL